MNLDTNSYWASNGKFQDLANQLQALIPAEGSVKNPRKNPALEKFRKAVNCYYDLYNNGLCNRKAEFSQVYGISARMYEYSYNRGHFAEYLYVHTEKALDGIILAAAAEQKLTQLDFTI